ncbi:hypothetical protein CFOL_v3_18229 [Cephalotus follicularis]|uniref:Uncharacterized protein n=1 Tax=Cephalotus follicularis TaxID=3775 RepID=A0A1Q3C3E8_CEPFO|nr:hypothetical protein CFOL_v3_18229 [Cephalotus follicularis]
MEGDLPHRRSAYFPGCMMSPSCFPVHEEVEYTRIDYRNGNSKRSRRWRNLLRRIILLRDGINIYRSSNKPLSFHYDAVSYAQNFDEGCHHEESGRCPQVLQDVR